MSIRKSQIKIKGGLIMAKKLLKREENFNLEEIESRNTLDEDTRDYLYSIFEECDSINRFVHFERIL